MFFTDVLSHVLVQRHLHNVLEKRRRRKLFQLFKGLRREVGLVEEKTSKIFTLNTVRLLRSRSSEM